MNLNELSELYFKKLGYSLVKSKHGFFQVNDGENPIKAVLIKDWNRSIGINVVRHFQDQLNKLSISKGFIVGRNFAYQVKKYCEDIYKGKVKILTESEMKIQMGL
ncbi:MAG: hypothetical protein ACTSVY_15170 [Candidatus Helarchaeota archaeon]